MGLIEKSSPPRSSHSPPLAAQISNTTDLDSANFLKPNFSPVNASASMIDSNATNPDYERELKSYFQILIQQQQQQNLGQLKTNTKTSLMSNNNSIVPSNYEMIKKYASLFSNLKSSLPLISSNSNHASLFNNVPTQSQTLNEINYLQHNNINTNGNGNVIMPPVLMPAQLIAAAAIAAATNASPFNDMHQLENFYQQLNKYNPCRFHIQL